MSRTAKIFLILLPLAISAHADSITTPVNLTDFLPPPQNTPPSDFGAGSSAYSFFDLGNQSTPQWTSPANAALTSNLLNLILTLGGDNALISQLFLPGAVFAASYSAPVVQVSSLVSPPEAPVPNGAPEPATIELLGGALLLLFGYAVLRVKRIRTAALQSAEPLHVPLRRPH